MEKMDWHYSNNEGEILGTIACLRDYSGGEAIECAQIARLQQIGR